jgi:hypothetical protein
MQFRSNFGNADDIVLQSLTIEEGGLVADAMIEQTVVLQVPIAVLYARALQDDGLCRKKKMRI